MTDFYCDNILSGKLDVHVVFETDHVLAFHHTKPYFENHIVIIPKRHIDSLSSPEPISAQLALEFMQVINKISILLENKSGGCRVSSNVGDYQSTKHLHWYVHSGKRIRNEDGSPIK